MNHSSYIKTLEKLLSINRQNTHRTLVVLEGDVEWAHSIVFACNSFLKTTFKNTFSILTYSEKTQFLPNVNQQNYRYKLGTECQSFVFSDEYLNLDAFTALSGTVVAGGVCFFVIPEIFKSKKLSDNDVSDSYFLQRFRSYAQKHENVIFWDQNLLPNEFNNVVIDECSIVQNVIQDESFHYSCKTYGQQLAVESILKVFNGHRNRPLVLTADRGRGKSSALAIACAEFLKNQVRKKAVSTSEPIIITAPNQLSLDMFFKQLRTSLQIQSIENSISGKLNNTEINHSHHNVIFMPVDELINGNVDARLILVDEAAGIPVHLLELLASKYSRLVFASTVHGYEGAGRGFALNFIKSLQRISPEMNTLHIEEPIRWANDDPLEKFVFDAFLLKASFPNIDQLPEYLVTDVNPLKPKHLTNNDKSRLYLRTISVDELLSNEVLLNNVFGILVSAHYQTSPNDLKLMLDNPQMKIMGYFYEETLIAVTLLMQEGKGEALEVIKSIKAGKRRIKDQFLPQALLTQYGLTDSFNYRYSRILRIAVHPELQSKGVGSLLLKELIHTLKNQVDILGASFAASQQLIHFWQCNHFTMARLGFTKDKASGEHSAIMLIATSNEGEAIVKQAHDIFYRHFHYWLSDEFSQLDSYIVQQILAQAPSSALQELTDYDRVSISNFVTKERLYNNCVLALHHWLLLHIKHQHENYKIKTTDKDNETNKYKGDALRPLIMKILQKKSIKEVCQSSGLTGKKALNQYIIDYIQAFI